MYNFEGKCCQGVLLLLGAAEDFFSPRGHALGLLGLEFDAGLSVTPLKGHLGCLASHQSVPVLVGKQ